MALVGLPASASGLHLAQLISLTSQQAAATSNKKTGAKSAPVEVSLTSSRILQIGGIHSDQSSRVILIFLGTFFSRFGFPFWFF